MNDIIGALTPTLPTTYMAWYHVAAIAIAGVVKIFRGSVMQQRALRIDLFGWSIILFDYVFGAVLLIGTVWAFYPTLHTRWFDLLTTTSLLIVAIWQGVNVWSAPDHRINRAMANHTPVNEHGVPIGEDRRKVVRREDDRVMMTRLQELDR